MTDMRRYKMTLAVTMAVCLVAAFASGKYMEKRKSEKKAPVEYIGRQEVDIKNGVLSPEALLALGRLSDPQLSPDGKTILYGVSYTDIAQNRSCRNIFVCNADGSDVHQLTREGKSISCARWSRDGRHIYYLQGGQLYKAMYKGDRLGRKTLLSDVAEGISEFSLSPDEKMILYVSTIPGPVKGPSDFDPALDKAQAYVADALMYRHWDHWVETTPRSFVASMGNGLISKDKSRDILGPDEPWELPTEPFGGIEQLAWHPDGKTIAYSCRKKMGLEYAFSTNCGIYLYDVESGESRGLKTDGGYDTDPVWSPDGRYLAWVSMERDGYEADRQRIMLYDSTDGSMRELTEGYEYDATGLKWLPSGKGLVFASTIKAIGALCYVPVEGGVQRLSPLEWVCSIDSPFYIEEGDRTFSMLTGYSTMFQPTELAKVEISASGSSIKQISAENAHILDKLNTLRQEQLCIRTPQGEDLYFWAIYPEGFDGVKHFPVVEMFNGGPQTCLDQHWSYRWNFGMMAHQGYVVLLPNRHGDSGFGQAWKEQISGDYQGLNMQDYMLVAKWAKEQPWCGKIAGVGASYGGFSVYNMMGIHNGLFDCFISHAGIFDEKMMWYTTEEAWFGNFDNGGLRTYEYTPGEMGPRGDGITFGGMQQAGAPYADVEKSRRHYANDPSSRVKNWNTPLLCIHGMMDFRIPYEQGMAAFNAAQMMGVPSRLVIFPEENHWILQPQNALFWHREFFGWLDKWLK